MDEPHALVLMDEAVEQALLGGQAEQEVQVGVAGLDAVLAGQVLFGEVLGVVFDAVLGEQGLENLRDAALLVDAPVRGQAQAGQARFDHGAVAGAAKAGVALLEHGDQAPDVTHGPPALPEGEVGGLVEDLAEVDGGVEAGQLQGQAVGLGEVFVEGEGHDLEVGGADGEGEAQIGLGGHAVLPAAVPLPEERRGTNHHGHPH